MTGLWFVTPCYRRFALTAVCLEQRRRVIEALAVAGIEAHCVVVADDENLDIASELGFSTVRRDNDWLGRKFNDGMEYAGRNGAEWVVPIGSDSWIDPAYFLGLPEPGITRTSPFYCPVEASRMVEILVGRGSGAGPYVFHRSLLEPSGFRPAVDEIPRAVDGSTITGIETSTGRPIVWQPYNLHGLQYVGFRGTPHITSYEKLKRRWGVRERRNPWPFLERRYPADLVAAARLALQTDATAKYAA